MLPESEAFQSLVLGPIEKLLNRGVGQSVTAQNIAKELEGRSVEVRMEGIPLQMRLSVTNGAIGVARTPKTSTETSTGTSAEAPAGTSPGIWPATPAEARISATPLGLLRLLGPGAQEAIRQGSVRFTGDTELAERFRKLLLYARPDLEEELSHLVGDAAAHEFGRFVSGLSAWGGKALASVSRSLSEYLQEESRVVPTKRELAAFAGEVDKLVNDVARAEANVRDAQAKLRTTDTRR
jgi:ubiquinone biosynthesis protein UbiJ